MTVQPFSGETNAQRRRRLLTDTRRLQNEIDATLLEYGDTTQEENRRRVNANIERSFPGVTEDEQSPIGMYMPSAEHFPEGWIQGFYGDAYETHMPMRRVLFSKWGIPTTNESIDESHPDYIKPWTDQEEQQWRNAASKMDQGVTLTGTAQVDGSRSNETIDLSPTFNQGENVERVTDGFAHGLTNPLEFSVQAPFGIDKENVKHWAAKHQQEVKETGIQDTEWKQRFERLKGDVAETAIPFSQDEASDQNLRVERTSVNNRYLRKHLNNLDSLWNTYSDTPSETSNLNIISSSGPRRRTIRGVAQSFVNNDDVISGASTGRNTMRHVPHAHTHYSDGWLDTSVLHLNNSPDASDRNTLYSYDTPIAWRQHDNTVIVSTQRHSNSTSKHQKAVESALHEEGYRSPERIANEMLGASYRLDRHRQTAGRPIGYEHYFPKHVVHTYIPHEETAHEIARGIADEHYEKVVQMQKRNAETANRRRPRNFLKPLTRGQQQRLEYGGQLRLPLTQADTSANERIMKYPITKGYTGGVTRRVNELLRQEEEIERRIYGE